MTVNEMIAYVVFTVFMIAFFVWVAYLALRR
jgi:predicted thioesterase